MLHDRSRELVPRGHEVGALPSVVEARRARRPKPGSFEAFKACTACPMCGDPDWRQGGESGLHIQGVWEAATTQQTRWHTVFECSPSLPDGSRHDVVAGRRKAERYLLRWGPSLGQDAALAARALAGGGLQMPLQERGLALRFALGQPLEPPDEDVAGSQSDARDLAKGVHVWVADALRAARSAAVMAMESPPAMRVLWRLKPRSVWMGKRGLREVWEGWRMSRMCFFALKAACAMHGPRHAARRHTFPAGVRATALPRPQDVGGACGASRAWHMAIAFEALRRELGQGGHDGRAAPATGALRARKALVHLRMAGRVAWTPKAHRAEATASRMKAAGEKATLRRAKRGQLVRALHASTFQRDWERVNMKHAAAFWVAGRRVSKREVSGQAGNHFEVRQAKAQRAHAAGAWAEHQREEEDEDRRDRAPSESGDSTDPRPVRAGCGVAGDRASPDHLKPPWRPPGADVRSGCLGVGLVGGRLPSMPVRAAGSAHGSAVNLGRGVRGKGAFPHGASRAQAMAKATAEVAKAAARTGSREAWPGRPRHGKRSREESVDSHPVGDTPPGVPRARAAYGESAGRSRSGPASIL